jgi:sugar-specific transcriptional regulator TrmB
MNALYTARNEDRLWTLGSEESINSYAENMIANTQHEAMLVLTDANLRRLRGVIVEADARGVDIGALLTGEENWRSARFLSSPRKPASQTGRQPDRGGR